MQITYSPTVLQGCPECKYLAVHVFNDVIMCIRCGWESPRTPPKEIIVQGEVYVLPDMKPNRKQRRRGRKNKR